MGRTAYPSENNGSTDRSEVAWVRALEHILHKYEGVITGPEDLLGGKRPGLLFYPLAGGMRSALDFPADAAARGLGWRRRVHPVLTTLAPLFLSCPQRFENRDFLRDPAHASPGPDGGITLPEEPVIWVSNHEFKDDVLATVLAAGRHAYVTIASLPQVYNTLDGLSCWINGFILANRKIRDSKRSFVPKAVQVLRSGADILIFPEGVWNKSPNRLLLDFWPGIYRIARQTGARVVPVVHYIEDDTCRAKKNVIHTVVDDPIRIDDLPQDEALSLLRDTMATWRYLMMEAYGRTSRRALLAGAPSPEEVWERQLLARVDTVAYYDRSIELCADYIPKTRTDPKQVWQPVAALPGTDRTTLPHVLAARSLISRETRNDYQRRF